MKDQLNCPNCGAPRDPDASRCPYCGTPYPATAKAGPVNLYIDYKTLAVAVNDGIITPNEARRRLGLAEI